MSHLHLIRFKGTPSRCTGPSLLTYLARSPCSSYVSSWLSLLRTHELLGDNRLKLAAQLAEISDELTNLGKEVDKSRKTTKELGTKLERGLSEQEGLVDKVSGCASRRVLWRNAAGGYKHTA